MRRLKIIRNSLRNSFLICGYKFILVEYTYGYSVTPLVSSGQCRYGLWNNLFRLSDHAIVAAFFKFVQPWGGFSSHRVDPVFPIIPPFCIDVIIRGTPLLHYNKSHSFMYDSFSYGLFQVQDIIAIASGYEGVTCSQTQSNRINSFVNIWFWHSLCLYTKL